MHGPYVLFLKTVQKSLMGEVDEPAAAAAPAQPVPVTQPTTQQPVQQPVQQAQQPMQQPMQQPIYEQPMYQQPMNQQPVYQQPVYTPPPALLCKHTNKSAPALAALAALS